MTEFRDRIKELRRVPASQIVGAPWNWREHPPSQVDALAASIEELGFFDPLDTYELPDGRLMLTDGHARRDLLHERIGPDTLIPCIVTDLTEEEAKKACLVKDPLAALAASNQGKLDELLASVKLQSPELMAMLEKLQAAARDSDDGDEEAAESTLPRMELLPYEHFDYVLILARDVNDWNFLCDKFKIERVDASQPGAKSIKKVGLGRAISAEKVIRIIHELTTASSGAEPRPAAELETTQGTPA